MALPFLGPLLAALGKGALMAGKGALGAGKLAGAGLWKAGSFIPQVAGKLLGGGRQVATVMGKPVTFGQTIQGAGAGSWLSKIPQALQFMQGLGGEGQQQPTEPTTEQQQQPPYTPQLPQLPTYSTTMPSYGEIIAKLLRQTRGF